MFLYRFLLASLVILWLLKPTAKWAQRQIEAHEEAVCDGNLEPRWHPTLIFIMKCYRGIFVAFGASVYVTFIVYALFLVVEVAF